MRSMRQKRLWKKAILPGGGVALIRCIPVLEKLASTVSGDIKLGVEIIIKSLSYPLKQIAENAGREGSIIVQKVAQMGVSEGWNAQTDEFGNMFTMGVLDPTKVVRYTIELAASIAGLLLTTEAIITDRPDDNAKPAAHAGMHGGEY